MDADSIKQVVRDVFGGGTKTEVINGWVSLACPLAPYTHAKGRDSKASAGISIHPNNVSVFNCYTCGNKMPIHGMLKKWSGFTGEDLESLIEELEEEAYLGPRKLPEWGASKDDGMLEQVPLKKSVYLELYDSAANHPYVRKRGVDSDTANLLGLMVDPADPSDGEERILFPVYGIDGELYGLSGRAIHPEARLKVRDYFGLRKAANLLGCHLIDRRVHKYVLVVEGLFDYANAWAQGQPAVAVMHSTLTSKQAEILRDISLPTYLFYDDDDAGKKGVHSAGKQLMNYVPVMKVRYPEIWIDNTEESNGGHYVKDPGELLEIEFKKMILDARLYYTP